MFIKWRKVGRPSSAVGPARESSIHKRSGKYVAFHNQSYQDPLSLSLVLLLGLLYG